MPPQLWRHFDIKNLANDLRNDFLRSLHSGVLDIKTDATIESTGSSGMQGQQRQTDSDQKATSDDPE